MNKGEPIEFVYELLVETGCEGVKRHRDQIRCKCPFHGGRNPNSFRVHFGNDDPFYNCFSCHEGGTLVELVAFLTGKSNKRSRRLVEKRTTLGVCDVTHLSKKFSRLKGCLKDKGFCVDELPPKAENQKPMFDYLVKRNKKSMHKHMRIEYIVNKYGLYYCCRGRMAGRIIMPIYIDGELISYNDRSIVEGARKSNHPSNSDFGKLIYGLQQAVGKPTCVLVEGAFDLFQIVSVVSTQKELSLKYGCVALMNNQLTEEKALLIAENFEEAVIFFDNDSSGRNGATKSYRSLRPLMSVKNVVQEIPKDKDPGKCRDKQIIKALKSKGYQPKGFIEKLRKKWK